MIGAIAPWLRAFAFTQLIEAPIYRSTLGVSWGRALAASTITHPFVWFVFPALRRELGASYVVYAGVAELFAWLVEAAYFVVVARVPVRRALTTSLLANAASVTLALLSRNLFGAP